MRILFTCSSRRWGGNEKWVAMALKQLAGKHEVYLAYRTEEIVRHLDPDIPRIMVPFTHLYHPGTFLSLKDFIRKHDIQCIVSTKRKEYNLCGLLAYHSKIKHVIRLGIVRRLKVPLWDRMLYRHLNDGIIVNARAIAEELKRASFMKHHRIQVIYNGVPIPPESPSKAEAGYFTISSVGSLLPRKGFDHLIQAFDYLPEKLHQKTRCFIIGSGPEDRNLQHLIQNIRNPSAITLHGFSMNPQKEIDRSDLFILLSENEGFPNAVLEAMAVGVPVLVTSAGGIGEFIVDGENGFLLDSTSPPEVARRITELAQRKDLKEIGLVGRERVVAEFSLDAMGRNLENFFREVIQGN